MPRSDALQIEASRFEAVRAALGLKQCVDTAKERGSPPLPGNRADMSVCAADSLKECPWATAMRYRAQEQVARGSVIELLCSNWTAA